MELKIDANNLIDLLECIQDANKIEVVSQTINEIIDIVYDLAEENGYE